MRITLDAFALIAALSGEPAASDVEAELRTGGVGITAANLAEVVDQMLRPARKRKDDLEASLASLAAGGLKVFPVDKTTGLLAGELRARHYHRSTAPISLGDCLALAASRIAGAKLATTDGPLAAVARREGVSVLSLPDSKGVRP